MSWVLFFDGDCAFCSVMVRWVQRLDRRDRLFFAPLQGKFAEKMNLSSCAAKVGGTMVLLRESDGQIFTHSEAVLELANALGGGWRWCRIGRWIPRAWRDAMYAWVADHRHILMGKSASCALPDPAVLKKLRE